MKLAAVIYAGSLSPHALLPIGAGGSAYERCLGFVRSLPGLEGAVVAEGGLRLPEGAFPKRHRESWTFDQVLEEMADIGQGADAVLLAWADEPFLDPVLAAKMLEDFRRYRAEYGFADGYPSGLAAEILAPRLIPAVRGLAASLPPEPTRTSLFTAIQKDINAFDIETDISPVDLRDLRLSLACDTKRNSLFVERLDSAGVSDASSALRLIPENLGLLRTLPAFIQIQVAAGCPQVCRLCPYPLFGPTGGNPASGGGILGLRRDMPRAKFASLLDQVVELCEDAVIDISLWGESSMHSDIGGLIGEVMSRPSLSLIIETSGLGWTDAFEERVAKRITSSGGAGRVDWVVSLDAASPELYAELRGEGFAEATAFAERLIELFPGRAHVQMVRARENEAELESFLARMEEEDGKGHRPEIFPFRGSAPRAEGLRSVAALSKALLASEAGPLHPDRWEHSPLPRFFLRRYNFGKCLRSPRGTPGGSGRGLGRGRELPCRPYRSLPLRRGFALPVSLRDLR